MRVLVVEDERELADAVADGVRLDPHRGTVDRGDAKMSGCPVSPAYAVFPVRIPTRLD